MAIANSLEELFQHIIPNHKERYISKLEGMDAKVFFEVVNEDGWLIILQNSNLTIEKISNTNGENCRIIGKRMIFEEILQGKRKILSSLMFGKIKFQGDLILAKKIASIFQE